MLDLPGHFVAPTVVTGLPAGHRLTREELFVPFVTVTRVGSFDAALAEANAIDYGLTAGVFSRDDAELARFLDEIEAGVVYVNRRAGATTGAWPGFQTFCGWKSSGSTGKGGLGPYYVQQFMREQSRTVVDLTRGHAHAGGIGGAWRRRRRHVRRSHGRRLDGDIAVNATRPDRCHAERRHRLPARLPQCRC